MPWITISGRQCRCSLGEAPHVIWGSGHQGCSDGHYICEALNRPIREPHPEGAFALDTMTDLLMDASALIGGRC